MRKPRIDDYRYWDPEIGAYRLGNGREAIFQYLNGVTPQYIPTRWDNDRTQPINLASLIGRNNIYPYFQGHYRNWNYWRDKNNKNLTREDKAFLKWIIRQGRMNDAPTKDPGVYNFGTEATKFRKKVSPKGLTPEKK